jgi:hypothetical protein
VKVASGARSVVFPSVAAPALESDFDSTLGAGRNAVALESGSWLVGHDALTFAPGRIVATLDRARYRTAAFVALARHALHQVAAGEPLHILTGMPPAWFADKSARADLEAALLEAAAPWGHAVATVAPEPAGVFYRHVFDGGMLQVERMQGAVGVIDAGFRDVGVALFDGGRYVAGESVPGGAHEALREIKRLISSAYGLELSLHQTDEAVRAGGLMLHGDRVALPAGTHDALTRSVDAVAGVARSLWPNGGRGLRLALLAGGGAHALGAALHTAFPQLRPLSNPQLAGAEGFALAAAAQVARKAAA